MTRKFWYCLRPRHLPAPPMRLFIQNQAVQIRFWDKTDLKALVTRNSQGCLGDPLPRYKVMETRTTYYREVQYCTAAVFVPDWFLRPWTFTLWVQTCGRISPNALIGVFHIWIHYILFLVEQLGKRLTERRLLFQPSQVHFGWVFPGFCASASFFDPSKILRQTTLFCENLCVWLPSSTTSFEDLGQIFKYIFWCRGPRPHSVQPLLYQNIDFWVKLWSQWSLQFVRESRANKFLETAPMAINTLCVRDLGQMTRNGAQCLGIDFVLVNDLPSKEVAFPE